MGTEQTHRELKRSAGLVVFLGILLVVLGILAMGAPMITGIAVTTLVGVVALVAGVGQMVYAFRAKSWGAGILTFLLGLLTLYAGGIMLARPLMSLAALTLFLAAYFIVGGIAEIVHGFQIKPLRGWGWVAFSGAVTMILGILIWRQWPVSGAWAIGLLFGIKVLFSGWSLIIMGSAARSAISEASAT